MDVGNSSGVALTVLILVLSAGCTAAPRPRTAPEAAPAVAEPLARSLCAAIHALPAERRKACCNTSGVSLADFCVLELSAALRRGTVTLDGAEIDRCAAETAQELEGCGWVRPVLPAPTTACRGLVHGTLAVGEGCRSSLECIDGLHCRGASLAGPGRCSAAAAARMRCEIPADNLAAMTASKDDPRHPQCQGRCVTGQCRPFVEAGAKCPATSWCQPGLHCIAGRCEDRPLSAAGEACTGSGCAPGAVCQDGLCAALKQRGAPCRLPFECRGLVCEKDEGASEGVCGDPCGSQSAG